VTPKPPRWVLIAAGAVFATRVAKVRAHKIRARKRKSLSLPLKRPKR
jgi:hypothetical protein